MRTAMLAAAGAAACVWLAPGAMAQDAQALYVKSLAATCANCHGTDGRVTEGSTVPGLAGMPRVYMLEQLRGFRDGKREATVMHQIVKGYSEQQLEQIATYFSALKR